MAVLFDSNCRLVFEAIARSPCRVADLVRELELPVAQVQRCLAELVGAGLVSPLRGESYGIAPSGLASVHRAIERAWVQRLALSFRRSLATAEPG